ncbi:MAG: hypothetical protein MJZ55_03160, partial [Paludibacteraceae bacterium]|nr:hypothetical protein [Paludibacteraceae bacterium]
SINTLFILAFTIVSYNVENLFDARHDTLKNDIEYTADGSRHWSYVRYNNKVEQVSRVICNIGGWDKPALVGLCEVENDSCLLRLCRQMRRYPYRFIHFESPDERGVDVAMLYDYTQFTPLDSMPLSVPLGTDRTRDILFVKGLINRALSTANRQPEKDISQLSTLNSKLQKDTLYIFVSHLPSMLGGRAASEWKRQAAKDIIRHRVDSILTCQPSAYIVVMGDMNSAPQEDINGLTNKMLPLEQQGRGTHYYQGRWSCLDQFYVSPSLDSLAQVRIYDAPFLLTDDPQYLNTRPRRTFNGYHYDRDGYSDHLPIILSLP